MEKDKLGLTINIKIEGKEELEKLKEDLKEIESTLDRVLEKKKLFQQENDCGVEFDIGIDVSIDERVIDKITDDVFIKIKDSDKRKCLWMK